MRYMKGQILDTGVSFILALVFVGILVGVGLLVFAGLSAGQPAVSVADNITQAGLHNATAGITNISLQLPTVGTIMGVGLILLVVFVAFGYFMTKGE